MPFRDTAAAIDRDALLDTLFDVTGSGILALDRDLRLVRMNEPCRVLLDLPAHLAEPGVPVGEILRHCAHRGDYGSGDAEDQVAEHLAVLSLAEPQVYESKLPGGRLVTARSRPVAGGGTVIVLADETDYRYAVDDLYAANVTLERSVAEHADDLARISSALEEATRRADQAVRGKARMLARILQELRMPVGGILAAARALAGRPQDTKNCPEGRMEALRILRQTETLWAMLADLADLVRLDADEIRLDHAPFAVEAVMGSVVAALGDAARERGIALNGRIAPAVPEMVMGDAAWLRHVLVDLVGQAVRGSLGGTVELRVEPTVVGDGRPGLRFSVIDGAPTLTREERTALLGEGLQGRQGVMPGMGMRSLALHVCRRLVELMGGTLGIDPGPAGGNLHWFTAALASAGAGSDKDPGPTLDILVVEDNPVNQRVNAWLLEKHGHRVTVTEDGKRAVELVATGGFDAVLMDLDIPGLDGIAATHAIRALDGGAARIPIIAITASALPGDAERCRAAGMDDHLSKPVNPAALARSLERLLPRGAEQPRPPEDDFDAGVLAALEGVIGRGNVAGMVEDFLDNAREIFGRLDGARPSRDLETLAAVAREVKAMAGGVGLRALYQAAETLETAARDGRIDDALVAADTLARRLTGGSDRLSSLYRG